MSDLISRQAAIRWVKTECNPYGNPTLDFESGKKVIEHLEQMPTAQPTNIQDILEYLNTVLHPIISPEHWNVYSELYDMISALLSAEPEIVRCKDCKWYGRADKSRFYRGMDCLNKRIATIVPDKDFCSRAERRDDGNSDLDHSGL